MHRMLHLDRHQQTVVTSWLLVAWGEQLHMLGVHHAHRLHMWGATGYVVSYLYLRAPTTSGMYTWLCLGAKDATHDAAINLA